MKHFVILLSILSLTACGGGSGSGSGNTGSTTSNTPGQSAYELWLAQGHTGTEQDFLDWLLAGGDNQNNGNNNQNQLTPAEILFGEGNGLDAIPTGLLTQTDLIGNEYFSFASWGDVYDIDHYIAENATNIPFFTTVHPESYSFMGTTINKFGSNLNKPADVSVADAVFTGPAVMRNHLRYWEENGSKEIDYNPDYGSVKITFGHDINNKVVEFTMHNPANNLILSNNEANIRFDNNRENLHVSYTLHNAQEPESRPVTTIFPANIGETFHQTTGYYYYDKIYEGYGSKQ